MIRLSFMSKLIKTGKQRPLIEEDLGHVSSNMKMDYLYSKLEYEWKKECQKDVSKRSFVKSMIRATGIGNLGISYFSKCCFYYYQHSSYYHIKSYGFRS